MKFRGPQALDDNLPEKQSPHGENLRRHDPLVEPYVRDPHLRMFDQTWKWAGNYRSTEKNMGVPHHEIRESLAAYAPDELAIRLHHRLVLIYPFANGNGRHARLMADVLTQKHDWPVFTWRRADLARAGDFRRRYIDALQAADVHDIGLLLAFARS